MFNLIAEFKLIIKTNAQELDLSTRSNFIIVNLDGANAWVDPFFIEVN